MKANKPIIKVFSKNRLFLTRFLISAFNLYEGINFEIVDSINKNENILILDETNQSIKDILKSFIKYDFEFKLKSFNFIYKRDTSKLDLFPELFASYIANYKNERVFYFTYLDIEESSSPKNNLLEEMIFNYYLNKKETLNNITNYIKESKNGYYTFYSSNINYILELSGKDLSEILDAVITSLNINYLVINYASDIFSFKKREYIIDEKNIDISKNGCNDFDLEKGAIDKYMNVFKCFKNKSVYRNLNLTKSDTFEIMEKIFNE